MEVVRVQNFNNKLAFQANVEKNAKKLDRPC